jgi:hypothetical protein
MRKYVARLIWYRLQISAGESDAVIAARIAVTFSDEVGARDTI